MTVKTKTGSVSSINLKRRLPDELVIFMCGCGMFIGWIALAAVLWRLQHMLWNEILTMGFAQLLIGRAASTARATEINIHPLSITAFVVYIDTMTVFLIYPVLVFSYRHLFEKRFFKAHIRPVFDTARKSMGKLGRFKIAGVFVFVWIPFWMTGILVGSVLGFLVGLRPWVNMATVVAATTTAVMCWVYAYDQIYKWAGSIHSSIPRILTILIIALLIVHRILSGRKQKQSGNQESAG
ncbi:hypothetical protein BVX94_02190 [bacterium B17]|nr:hypothetical protein BVX94_02190 [bacterium B17]